VATALAALQEQERALAERINVHASRLSAMLDSEAEAAAAAAASPARVDGGRHLLRLAHEPRGGEYEGATADNDARMRSRIAALVALQQAGAYVHQAQVAMTSEELEGGLLQQQQQLRQLQPGQGGQALEAAVEQRLQAQLARAEGAAAAAAVRAEAAALAAEAAAFSARASVASLSAAASRRGSIAQLPPP
jgi:hypothetical protein